MMISDSTRAFVAAHRHDDVRDLALHARRDADVDMPMALDQIAGWRTASRKLPEWAACDDVLYPPHLSMEQCSSQFTARYKEALARRIVAPEAGAEGPAGVLVDLTGGFGVDCSYMSRAFTRAVYVERQPHLCALARHNMAALGLGHVDVVQADASDYVASMDRADMVFIDPARRDGHGGRTYAIADCTPDVLGMLDAILAVTPHLMVKLSPMLDWRKTVEDFRGHVEQVHLVSTGNECKELLLVVGRGTCDDPLLVCVNDDQRLECHASETDGRSGPDAATVTGDGDGVPARTYLFEPNASVMKAGCFSLLEERFDVHAVGRNSHLFLAGHDVAGFPGRRFVVERTSTMGRKELRAALSDLTHANIAVRNFPMSVEALRRRLKLKDGGDAYLFATTDHTGRHIVIRAVKA
ncbi:class I SAM-dependent methyltransferase [Bifidobacterium saguinibicoloris]|uniref:class I SAM-dependent methyltransferase n=1 Tax=Bifidobacterium saguinibicoloris TaxID=2834433 RepID=UPI001C59512F|nr:class I SAM-dependent methyltransferase [Bifidobacterium saguinibicoloris]MBW3080645.1 SAM-dependent methyltransferase [Bifidobacterium saguinibicoloris]